MSNYTIGSGPTSQPSILRSSDNQQSRRAIEDLIFELTTMNWQNDLDVGLDVGIAVENENEDDCSITKKESTVSGQTDPLRMFLRIDLFVVMKLYDRSLKDVLERRGENDISADENSKILRELLLALDYISQRGVVHRDISPCNIFFDSAGRAVLGDFGLAAADRRTSSDNNNFISNRSNQTPSPLKRSRPVLHPPIPTPAVDATHNSIAPSTYRAAARRITRMSTHAVLRETLGESSGGRGAPSLLHSSGESADAQSSRVDSGAEIDEDGGVGKPLYASPEQWERIGAVGVKADIFSLGVMWVEMHLRFCTGRERIEVLSAVRQGNLPATFVNKWPAAAKIAEKMLCARPADRASAAQLLDDPFFKGSCPKDEGMGGRCWGEESGVASSCSVEVTREMTRLRQRVAELTFQNFALRRMLHEVCS